MGKLSVMPVPPVRAGAWPRRPLSALRPSSQCNTIISTTPHLSGSPITHRPLAGSDLETLKALQASAEAGGKGVWGPNPEKHVRSITWSVPDMRAFVDSLGGKPVDGEPSPPPPLHPLLLLPIPTTPEVLSVC